MIDQASVGALEREQPARASGAGRPSGRRPAPAASRTRPIDGRADARRAGAPHFMYQPISMAIGIVAPTVNVPHGLLAAARSRRPAPSTAIRMIMIENTPTSAAKPPNGPISSCAIWPSERPSRRRLPHEDAEVLHRAAEHDADEDPERAGQVAELRRERRADQRPGPGDGREVMAEDDPAVGRHEVAAVVDALRRRRPRRRRARTARAARKAP